MTQPNLFPEFPVVDALKSATKATEVKFDGKTYEPKRDRNRLAAQALSVFNAMKGGEWFTLDQLHNITGAPHASISARMRDFRKARFGGHTVNRRHVGDGLYQYQLVLNAK